MKPGDEFKNMDKVNAAEVIILCCLAVGGMIFGSFWLAQYIITR